ncbi:MAG: glycosyltransferase [Lachnospiraceae bacterium]|nr:glycosyltransferase [Lachnospiraceae bacterium]
MKFSIIIPVYNADQYIDRCLKSILKQEMDFEIICVDDGSSDQSKEILDRYEKQYHSVNVIYSGCNEGPSIARNKGLRAASGEYIWFVDSDDYISDNSLIELHNMVQSEQPDFVTFGSVNEFKTHEIEEKYNRGCAGYTMNYNVPCTGVQLMEQLLASNELVTAGAWRYIYNRKFLLDNKLFFLENIINEDVLFVIQCYLSANKVILSTKNFYHYFRRDSSITTTEDAVTTVKNFFVCYSELFKYAMVTKDIEKQKAVIQILDLLAEYIQQTRQEVQQDVIFEDIFRQYMYGLLFDDSKFQKNQKTFLDEFVLSESNVYIYGAGTFARRILEMLNVLDVKINGVLVTKKNRNTFMGHEVIAYEDLDEKKENVTVVIGIKGENGEKVRTQLRQDGYKNVI